MSKCKHCRGTGQVEEDEIDNSEEKAITMHLEDLKDLAVE